jgi:hypothetical protein
MEDMLYVVTKEEAAMTVKIPLRLQGIDLRDTEAYDRVPEELDELFWMSNGAVSLAVLFSDDPPPVAVADATDWARRVAKLIPGVFAAEVHDELVSISDIAARANVAHEAVRLWTTGKRRASIRSFPVPRQVVGSGSGGKTMNLYAWREVLAWIREVVGIDPDEGIDYLTDGQRATLNAELSTIREEWVEWRPITVETEQIIVDVQHMCAQQAQITIPATHLTDSDDADGAKGQHHKIRVTLQ